MTPDELQLIADTLAWTEGFDYTGDDRCTGDALDRVWTSAAECAEHLDLFRGQR